MNGEAIVELKNGLARPVEVGGVIARPDDWTLVDPVSLIQPGPSATPLGVSTLGAVRDYLTANKDQLDLTRLVVQVISPTRVTILGPIQARDRTREVYLSASCLDLTDGWLERFHPLEDFLIGLQTRVVNSDERPRLLALLGNVKHEQVKTATDDGVTQIVTARAGVALVSEVAVPNPVLLAGYRTFRDIPQPSSLFVVRVKAGPANGLPLVGLFEADGGAWRLTAVERIRTWLTDALPPAVGVLA